MQLIFCFIHHHEIWQNAMQDHPQFPGWLRVLGLEEKWPITVSKCSIRGSCPHSKRANNLSQLHQAILQLSFSNLGPSKTWLAIVTCGSQNTELTKPLWRVLKEEGTDSLIWTSEQSSLFNQLKNGFYLAWPFYVPEWRGVALGVLTQKAESTSYPEGHLSKKLDLVAMISCNCLNTGYSISPRWGKNPNLLGGLLDYIHTPSCLWPIKS